MAPFPSGSHSPPTRLDARRSLCPKRRESCEGNFLVKRKRHGRNSLAGQFLRPGSSGFFFFFLRTALPGDCALRPPEFEVATARVGIRGGIGFLRHPRPLRDWLPLFFTPPPLSERPCAPSSSTSSPPAGCFCFVFAPFGKERWVFSFSTCRATSLRKMKQKPCYSCNSAK